MIIYILSNLSFIINIIFLYIVFCDSLEKGGSIVIKERASEKSLFAGSIGVFGDTLNVMFDT